MNKFPITEQQLREISENIYADGLWGENCPDTQDPKKAWFDIAICQINSNGSLSEDLHPIHCGYEFGVNIALRRLRENFVHNFIMLLKLKGFDIDRSTDTRRSDARLDQRGTGGDTTSPGG